MKFIRFSQLVLLLALFLPLHIRADVALSTGVVVPTDSMIVFILVGHSNMSGRTSFYGTDNQDSLDLIYSTYADEDPFLWNFLVADGYNEPNAPIGTWYLGTDKSGLGSGSWVPARMRLSRDYYDDPPGELVNVGMPFLKKIRNYYPKHHIGVIHIAFSSAQLKAHFVDDYSWCGINLWSQIKDALSTLKGKVKFGGVITQLGMRELWNNDFDMASRYRTDLDTLITRIRTIADDPNIPFLVSDLEQASHPSNNASFSIGTTTGLALQEQFFLAQSEIPHTKVIDTDWSRAAGNLFVDGAHYSRTGMMRFADACVDALLSIPSIAPYCTPGNAICAPAPLSSYSRYVASSSSLGASSSSMEPAFVITSPSSGSSVYVGETIAIQWTTDLTQAQEAYPMISLDKGRSWLSMGFLSSILTNDPMWQNVSWLVPDTMENATQEKVALAGLDVQIRLTTYTGNATGKTSFRIESLSSSSRIEPFRTLPLIQVDYPLLWVNSPEQWEMKISSLMGKTVHQFEGKSGKTALSLADLPTGFYICRISKITKLIYWLR